MTRALHIGLLGAIPEEIGSDLSHLRQLSSEITAPITPQTFSGFTVKEKMPSRA